MLQPNKLRASLAAGQCVYGLINSIPAPLAVEMIGYAGFDFVILDLEHAGPSSIREIAATHSSIPFMSVAWRGKAMLRKRPAITSLKAPA